VPILLAGVHAQALVEALSPFGMRLEVVSEQIGVASATKMCRSIVIKGLESLILECLVAAHRFGAEERVLASLAETFPSLNWPELAGYMIGRVIEHGGRRAREMEEVAETLRAADIEPMMAEAIARRQDWGAGLKLKERLSTKELSDYRELLRAIEKKQ
jgi:3-hydroxyisobutyrate dehydrogenase-like beta-hydroxyacid dehydrogenase